MRPLARTPTPRRRIVAALSAALAAGVLSPAGPSIPGAAADQARRSSAPCPSRSAHPWCERSLSPATRARLFLKAMTRDEEVTMVGGDGTGASPHTGATFAIPRLGLRAVYFSDGPVGVRQGEATAMPIPMALAATWDQRLARAHGRVVGREARDKGNDVVFAPTVNIMRTPQGGRTFEAYGEDTYLVARTGVGWIRGAQGAGVIGDVKHFAVNNQEGQGGVPPLVGGVGSRHLVDVHVGERALREVYLPHFEAAVKQARVGSIMCSYNRINGPYACENPHTLQRVLRRQWRFKGIALADYGASKDTAGNMNNGLDFVPAEGTVDHSYDPIAINAVLASGQVTRKTLDRHVFHILRTLFAYGVFDRPAYRNNDDQIPVRRDQRAARRIEQRAITLLKNRGVLPLKPGVDKIAVIGPYADRFVTGGGSGSVKARHVVTALKGITRRAGRRVHVTYRDGSDQAAAAAAAKAADVAVVVVGDVETEGQDKDCLGLNCTSDAVNSGAVLFLQGKTCGVDEPCPLNGTDQDGLIRQVAAAQPKTVVVLETGAPVLTPWRRRVPAILAAWYPGQEGGTALAHVLFGDTNPSGRLPVTFPRSASQVPTAGNVSRYPGTGEDVYYKEGVFVGYKWYDRHHLKPAFAFGHGLSYTSFRYGPLHVKRVRGHVVAVTRVTNTGHRAGVSVPQLYLHKPARQHLRQPVRQLVGYAAVRVPAGRTALVRVPLVDRSFATWTHGRWRILSGCYRLDLGRSSRQLVDTARVARGSACPGAMLRLGTTGRFFRPLPLPARSRLLPRR